MAGVDDVLCLNADNMEVVTSDHTTVFNLDEWARNQTITWVGEGMHPILTLPQDIEQITEFVDALKTLVEYADNQLSWWGDCDERYAAIATIQKALGV